MGTPLRPPTRGLVEGDTQDAPEALFLSALIESGDFDPGLYHVDETQIEAWDGLYELCEAYQKHAGKAPPEALIAQRFPEFVITRGIDPSWAAEQVRKAAATRDLRTNTRTMLGLLADEDLEGAFEILDNIKRPSTVISTGISVFDDHLITEENFADRIDVPYNTIRIASRGGIGSSELWWLAARLGQGKTHEAINYGSLAATLGNSVAFISLEMPAIQINNRALRRLAGKNNTLVEDLRSEEISVRKAAVHAIEANTPGSFHVYDPSRGNMGTLGAVRDLCSRYDLVILDHVGLMKDNKGRRAIEDWRIQAEISNTLREITLATKGRLLGLVQINRAGEQRNAPAPPGVENLAGSDALGQDADVIITMKRLSNRVMIHSGEKVREGPNVKWWTRFDPARNRFEEISRAIANDLMSADGDAGEHD